MGRYYNGDIEGKFWFAVQSSDDADFFGARHAEPNVVNYDFSKDDLPSIRTGVVRCRGALGDYKAKLDAFFAELEAKHSGYDDRMLADYLGLPYDHDASDFYANRDVTELLEWYARLELGEKILTCVEATDECNFEAEL